MRAVIDTNVLLSGRSWTGTPHKLPRYLRANTLILVSSPLLFDELAAVLARPKFSALLSQSAMDAAGVMTALRTLAEIVYARPLPQSASRDRDDDAVLAVAVAAQADLIISGDGDLLTLGTYAGIPIVTPAAALARLDQ